MNKIKWYLKPILPFLIKYSLTVTVEDKVVIIWFKHFMGTLIILNVEKYVKEPQVESNTKPLDISRNQFISRKSKRK